MGKQVICEHNITPKNRCRDCQRAANRRSMAKHITPAVRHEKYLANRARQIVYVHNSRANKLGVPGEITAEDYEQVASKPCVYCGYDTFIEVDHRVPMSKGGTNTPDNLQPVCRYCNRSKHWFSEAEFLIWLNRLKQAS
jgi:5-methylcytosine-specific restriction endonuclease McrA